MCQACNSPTWLVACHRWLLACCCTTCFRANFGSAHPAPAAGRNASWACKCAQVKPSRTMSCKSCTAICTVCTFVWYVRAGGGGSSFGAPVCLQLGSAPRQGLPVNCLRRKGYSLGSVGELTCFSPISPSFSTCAVLVLLLALLKVAPTSSSRVLNTGRASDLREKGGASEGSS